MLRVPMLIFLSKFKVSDIPRTKEMCSEEELRFIFKNA